jgi:hypothetical protein
MWQAAGIVSLVMALSVVGTSLAAPASSGAPQLLHSEQTIGGDLIGNAAGAFAYYSIAYPGDDNVATIELRFTPADPVTLLGVGFNVYAANGFFIGQALPAEDTTGQGLMTLQYGDSTQAEWLIQVYNYLPGHSVAYEVTAYGYADAPEASPTPEPVPAEPEAVATLDTTMTGTLVGNAAGSYALYNLEYPGGKKELEVELWYIPADPVTASAVGLNVYGENGKLVARGNPRANTGGAGRLSASYSRVEPESLTLQVYNYLPGTPVEYSLESRTGS